MTRFASDSADALYRCQTPGAVFASFQAPLPARSPSRPYLRFVRGATTDKLRRFWQVTSPKKHGRKIALDVAAALIAGSDTSFLAAYDTAGPHHRQKAGKPPCLKSENGLVFKLASSFNVPAVDIDFTGSQQHSRQVWTWKQYESLRCEHMDCI